MTTMQLMDRGRKEIKETDGALDRTEKLVEDTLEIGKMTAATLYDQTAQLNKIVDDLNEMEFTMKKASKARRWRRAPFQPRGSRPRGSAAPRGGAVPGSLARTHARFIPPPPRLPRRLPMLTYKPPKPHS